MNIHERKKKFWINAENDNPSDENSIFANDGFMVTSEINFQQFDIVKTNFSFEDLRLFLNYISSL